jgi:hypothetical protein
MLSGNALGMVMSLANGIVKLAGRLDMLMAEKEAVQGPLYVPMPVIQIRTVLFGDQLDDLERYLKDTAHIVPDPLGTRRAQLVAAIEVKAVEVTRFFEQIFPDRAGFTIVDPENAYIQALKQRLPGLDLENADTRLAALYLRAGQDARGIGYVTRTALLVTDVLAEFGVEHASQFITHAPTRDLVTSIVGRFAEPDLDSFTEWGPLLRHGLVSALEGMVENKAAIEGSTPWLGAILSAVTAARDDPAGGTDFITGLVNGKGYQLLFSKGLLLAADRLAPEGAGAFNVIAADVLRGAAPLVRAHNAGFRSFFNDHWGDLLHAGLVAVDKHGPALLAGERPLLREVTLAVVKELSTQPELTRLSGDAVFHLVDIAIAVVAKDPSRLNGADAQPWLKAFVAAAVAVGNDQRVRAALGADGIEQVLLQGLGVLGDHPELVGADGAARVQWIGSVLAVVTQAGALDAKILASAAVTGVLERMARQPNLLTTRYADILAALTGDVAMAVKARGLSGVQATQALHACADAVLRNPALFDELGGQVAPAVVAAVLDAARSGQSGLLAGDTLVQLLDSVLSTVARHGQPLLALPGDAAALQLMLTTALKAGLARAEVELGHRLDASDLPPVLAALVAAVARGDITGFDPGAKEFQQAFASLVETVA